MAQNSFMEKIKVGSWTNQGRVLFIDRRSELVPDPLCKVSSTMLCSHRLSQLFLVEKPQSEVDREAKILQLMGEKAKLQERLKEIDQEMGVLS